MLILEIKAMRESNANIKEYRPPYIWQFEGKGTDRKTLEEFAENIPINMFDQTKREYRIRWIQNDPGN